MFSRLCLALIIGLTGVEAQANQPAKKPVARKPASTKKASSVVTKQEQMDRVVDVAAVSSRETAITNLKRLLRMKRGTKEEAGLLWRLADMEWRATKNHFRVGVTSGEKSESARRYDELLHAVVDHTSEIMKKFPKFKDIREVLLRRGRAYEELKQKQLALKDYLDYIGRYSDEPQTVQVRLMAADVMAEFEQHKEILQILRPVDVNQSHNGLVGHVVERQALAFFHTEQYPEALRKAEWLLRYDRGKGLNKEKGSHYDEVIGMVALFYGTAFEKRLAGYSLEHALDYFRKLEGGQILGKLSHEFVLVMRSKEMQAEVIDWKDLHLRKIPGHPDTLFALVDAYDAILNWKVYPKFLQIEKDFDLHFDKNPANLLRAQNEDSFKKFKKNLLEFADKIYETLPKKDPSIADYQVISEPYLTALNAFLRITDPRDELKAKVRFRVGEFYVGMKNWDMAQKAFTDVYQAKLFPVKDQELRDSARIRAMTARYDYFKDRGVIPKDLKPLPLSASAKKKPLPQDVAEWIRWVDEVAALKIATQAETMDKLLFEANRLVYSYGDIDAAYKRMLQYIGLRPESKLTPPTCALVIDTLIESEAWVATRTLSQKFQKMPNVAVGEFKTKLEVLEQDSHYKITQNFFKTKDYAKAMQFGKEHLELYPNTKRKVDILAMLGKSSLETKDEVGSLAYMSQVIELNPNHDTVGVAYFIRAQDHEKAFRFKQAFDDYYKAYKLPADKRGFDDKDLPALKKKLFILGLTSDEPSILKRIAEAPEFCGEKGADDLRLECARFAATQALKGDAKKTAWEYVDMADRSPASVKSAWYAVALMKGNQLPNTVIKRVVEDMQKSFDKLDAMTQMEVLSSLNETVAALYDKKVETVEALSKIDKRMNQMQGSIEKRVKETAGLENLAAALILVPAPEVRVRVLGRLSAAYQKVADELKEIPVPKGFAAEEADVFKQAIAGMLTPLYQKYEQLGQQTWDIAKKFGLQTTWVDQVTNEQMASDYADANIKWNVKEAMLEALPEEVRKSPWALAVKNRQERPMIFFFQLSNTPAAEKLGLGENEKTLLQFATLAAMHYPANLVQLAKDKETQVQGEALRMSYMIRLHSAVLAQSYQDIKAVRTLMKSRGFDDENREEAKIVKLAKKFDEKFSELIAKAEAESLAKAQADAKAKADQQAQERAVAKQPPQKQQTQKEAKP